ncbi:hypothetical protein GDO86_016547 [Hymenochirus boettgeri]|uniref:Ig-like domain-containing protein n=1 Tax=Hymenochirus boettgeri TaxID=247094 RepID=A0A8T2JZZ4_9PIPI|nr:hypothetical protein GDO86_016547 [Hymenochirus boettgeri]
MAYILPISTITVLEYYQSVLHLCMVTQVTGIISITELFSTPEIKVNSHRLVQGNNLSLSCNTVRKSLPDTNQLQFAFHKNKDLIQISSLSNVYHIMSVQLEDSGNYYCIVHVNRINKTSQVVNIQVHGHGIVTTATAKGQNDTSRNNTLIITLVLLVLLLIIAVLVFACKDRLSAFYTSSYPTPDIELPLDFPTVHKGASHQTTNTGVIYAQLRIKTDTESTPVPDQTNSSDHE